MADTLTQTHNPQDVIDNLRRMARSCAEHGDRATAIKLFSDADTVQGAAVKRYNRAGTVFEETTKLVDGGANRIEHIGNGRKWYLTDGKLWYPLRKGFDLEFARVYLQYQDSGD